MDGTWTGYTAASLSEDQSKLVRVSRSGAPRTKSQAPVRLATAARAAHVDAMKNILITVLAAVALVGCNNPERDAIEQSKDATQDSLNAQKKAVDDSADAARNQVDSNNKADKARIDAQEKATKAQIEADKTKVDAAADAAKKQSDARQEATKP
jgi:hypothetical protein